MGVCECVEGCECLALFMCVQVGMTGLITVSVISGCGCDWLCCGRW